jgi:small subunit ribosomal protein S1
LAGTASPLGLAQEDIPMSEPEQPAVPPTPPQQQQPAPPAEPAQTPPPREGSQQSWRSKVRRERPREKPDAGKVPSLQHEQTYGGKVPIDKFDAAMERELQEAMGNFSDEALNAELSSREQRQAAPTGPKKGRVFRIHGGDVFIDMPGGRTQGVISMQQFPEGPPAIGTEIEVTIEGFDGANGVLLLSRKGSAVEADWSSVAVGMIIEARVVESNKGGLAVDINGIRGFLPISQIELFRIEDLAPYVNQRLRCMVTEVDPLERNLVISRRVLLEKEREESRDKLWQELAEGQVRQGIVRSVKDFGAFVDLGGVDGLLHVSEMSWTRVKDATQVVQPGQSLRVLVLKIDREHRKVSLGLKQLMASPWDDIEQKYHAGQLVTGKVSRLMDFGAFVELEPAVEGLIHISELSPNRVRRVAEIVKEGQEVQVKVLSVDAANRRISLSLKAAMPEEPEPEAAEEEAPQEPAKPPRPRTTPLRGGIGNRPILEGGAPDRDSL